MSLQKSISPNAMTRVMETEWKYRNTKYASAVIETWMHQETNVDSYALFCQFCNLFPTTQKSCQLINGFIFTPVCISFKTRRCAMTSVEYSFWTRDSSCYLAAGPYSVLSTSKATACVKKNRHLSILHNYIRLEGRTYVSCLQGG